MDEKKLHTREFQLKGIGRNMRRNLLQKRSAVKTTECSKHLRHIATEKDIFSELTRCIFQISLKYIKLVIPEILFILVLCNLNFYFKNTWPKVTQSPFSRQYQVYWTPKKFWQRSTQSTCIGIFFIKITFEILILFRNILKLNKF